MNIINFALPETGNFLVDVILWLVTITGSVAVGIVLFTVLLKVITLPFDFISKISMRKNSLLMEEMRPDLEKLQKQYADNKELYNQKMMALYKKNGYSMFGSCLPSILTLVIFIVAINGFNAYSQYQNRVYFYEMSKAYNSVIYEGFEKDGEYITVDANGQVIFADEKLYKDLPENQITLTNHKIIAIQKHNAEKVLINTENGFVRYNAGKYELITDKMFTDKSFALSNDVIFAGFELDNEYIVKDTANKKLVIDNKKIYDNVTQAMGENKPQAEIVTNKGHKIIARKTISTLIVYTENGYVNYKIDFNINEDGSLKDFNQDTVAYTLIEDNMFNQVAASKESASYYFGFETDSEYVVKNENALIINEEKIISNLTKKVETATFDIFVTKTDLGYAVYTENGYMKYFREVDETAEEPYKTVSFNIVSKNIENKTLANEKNNNLTNEKGQTYSQAKAENEQITPEDFIKNVSAVQSAKAYRSNQSNFLWVKNIWIADVFWEHPVLDYSKFTSIVATQSSGCGCSCNAETSVPVTEAEYNLLTSQLQEEKNAPNGYLILCILSIGVSLLSQLIMNKSQKAQLELQTVDGQGAQNQKMMTYMMPIMMAIFSFIYTSAFSIYIIVNSIITILTTLVINLIVDSKYKKAEPKKQIVRGRVYVKPEEPKEDKKKAKKKDKKENTEEKDFLSGLADKKKKRK